MGRLEGKVAIITGGNSGVGAATAKLFAKEGAKVIITARRVAPLEEVAAAIREAGGEVLPVVTDISKKGDADKLVAKAVETYGKLDILVNDDLDQIVEINQKGTMYCMRAATAEMSKTGYGSIVNVASIAGVMGCGGAVYVSTKAAVIGVTRHTALRFAGTNIRCNAVCPGTIVTPMVAGTDPTTLDPDMMGQMAKHSDLKVQPCMPDDVANILLFLASDESRAITGQALQTDFGGTL